MKKSPRKILRRVEYSDKDHKKQLQDKSRYAVFEDRGDQKDNKNIYNGKKRRIQESQASEPVRAGKYYKAFKKEAWSTIDIVCSKRGWKTRYKSMKRDFLSPFSSETALPWAFSSFNKYSIKNIKKLLHLSECSCILFRVARA